MQIEALLNLGTTANQQAGSVQSVGGQEFNSVLAGAQAVPPWPPGVAPPEMLTRLQVEEALPEKLIALGLTPDFLPLEDKTLKTTASDDLGIGTGGETSSGSLSGDELPDPSQTPPISAGTLAALQHMSTTLLAQMLVVTTTPLPHSPLHLVDAQGAEPRQAALVLATAGQTSPLLSLEPTGAANYLDSGNPNPATIQNARTFKMPLPDRIATGASAVAITDPASHAKSPDSMTLTVLSDSTKTHQHSAIATPNTVQVLNPTTLLAAAPAVMAAEHPETLLNHPELAAAAVTSVQKHEIRLGYQSTILREGTRQTNTDSGNTAVSGSEAVPTNPIASETVKPSREHGPAQQTSDNAAEALAVATVLAGEATDGEPQDTGTEHPKRQGSTFSLEVPAANTSGAALTFASGKVDSQKIERSTSRALPEIADKIEQLAGTRKGGMVTIHLSPQDLGTITLTVKSFGQRVDADITASNEQVRTNLEATRGLLIQQVESKGLSLGSLSVGNQPGGGAQQGQSASQQEAQQDFQRYVNVRAGASGVETGTHTQPSWTPATATVDYII